MAPFLASVRRSRAYLAKAQRWMQPLVADILSQEREKSGPIQVGARGTFVSWLLDYLPEHLKTPERIGSDQMIVSSTGPLCGSRLTGLLTSNQVSFAAIHTTSSTGTLVRPPCAVRGRRSGK